MIIRYGPEQGQAKGYAIIVDEENGHVQQYVSLAIGVHGAAWRPHVLRDDSASLTDCIV